MKQNYTKKIISILSILLLGLVVNLKAQLQFTIGSKTDPPTPTISIPVTTQNFSQILAIQGSINWDNTKLTYNSVTNIHSQLTGISFNSSTSSGIGRLSYVWTDNSLNPQTITNGSVLFNIVFNLVPTATGTISLAFSNTPTALLVSDQNVQPVSGVVYNSGTVTLPWSLPTKLFDFSVVKKADNVKLTWTATNNSSETVFQVEKSDNGINFNKLASINSVATNSTQIYTFETKISNSTKDAFFRIKCIEKDGEVSYSKIIKISSNVKNELSIYPNPSKESIFLKLYTSKNEEATVQFFTQDGKLAGSKKIQLFEGENTNLISITELPTGTYTVKVKSQLVNQVTTFIKL